MIASGLPGRRLTACFVSPALSQCQLAAARPKYYRLHVWGARSPPVKSLSQKPGLVGQCLTNVLRKVAESAPDEICRHASFAAQLSKASFSPVAKCNRMCFKEPRCRKNKRHDILKSSTENIQQADLPGLALSENPKLNTQLSRVEVGMGVAILIVLLGFQGVYVNAQHYDSDEPQHLD